MNSQRAFKDMSEEELRSTVLEVVTSKGMSPYSNLEGALKELYKRYWFTQDGGKDGQ